MPFTAVVNQNGVPSASGTVTFFRNIVIAAAPATSTTEALACQSLPQLVFWVQVFAGGPVFIQPQFSMRSTGEGVADGKVWQDLVPGYLSPGVGGAPVLLTQFMPCDFIRMELTHAVNPTTVRIVLAAGI